MNEDLQAAIDSRLRRSSRLSFFDDEDGDDDAQHEPDDIHVIAGIVDRRGLPEFSKAAKYTGAWLGMVFKRGQMGLGYYRDEIKLNLKLMGHINAEADVAPVMVMLDEVIPDKTTAKTKRKEEPDTCPRRKTTSTGRKGEGVGLDTEWPKDDSLAASSSFHVTQGHWAFDSVNGSCWNTAAEYLTQSAADFVAVHEATIADDSIADTEQAARNKGWRTAINPCISDRSGRQIRRNSGMQQDVDCIQEFFRRRMQCQTDASTIPNETLWCGVQGRDSLWILLPPLQLGAKPEDQP